MFVAMVGYAFTPLYLVMAAMVIVVVIVIIVLIIQVKTVTIMVVSDSLLTIMIKITPMTKVEVNMKVTVQIVNLIRLHIKWKLLWIYLHSSYNENHFQIAVPITDLDWILWIGVNKMDVERNLTLTDGAENRNSDLMQNGTAGARRCAVLFQGK